jgi:Tat protein translocase TatC
MSTRPGQPEESLMGHLLELRSRLLRGVVAVLAVFLALMPFASQLYERFSSPLLAKLPSGSQLQAIDVAGGFFIPIKLAFFAALLVAMPYLIYQAWAFVAPGLYQSEKKLARPILLAAVALFYIGCAFAWFLVLPMVFGFLAMFTPDTVTMIPDVARYLDFVLVILLAFGLRTAGGRGDPGGAGRGDASPAARGAWLRGGGRVHPGRRHHPARRGVAADAGDPAVPALRDRHHRRRAAAAQAGPRLSA